MEIVNADTEWRDESILALLSSLFALPVLPQASWNRMVDRPSRNLALFDRINRERPLFLIGSLDAHAAIPLVGDLLLPFPSYRSLFRGIRTHILLESPPTGEVVELEWAKTLVALRVPRTMEAK